jgi:hypothetical protein
MSRAKLNQKSPTIEPIIVRHLIAIIIYLIYYYFLSLYYRQLSNTDAVAPSHVFNIHQCAEKDIQQQARKGEKSSPSSSYTCLALPSSFLLCVCVPARNTHSYTFLYCQLKRTLNEPPPPPSTIIFLSSHAKERAREAEGKSVGRREKSDGGENIQSQLLSKSQNIKLEVT